MLTALKAYGPLGAIVGGFFLMLHKHGWPKFSNDPPPQKTPPELAELVAGIAEIKTSLAVIEALIGGRRK